MSVKPTVSERSVERVAEAATGSMRSEDKSRRTCYLCQQVGHMRKQCPLNRQGSKGATEQWRCVNKSHLLIRRRKPVATTYQLQERYSYGVAAKCRTSDVSVRACPVSPQIFACLLLQVR